MMINQSLFKLNYAVFIFDLIVLLTSCSQIYSSEFHIVPCVYYPNFPDKSSYYAVNCTNICCPPQTDKVPEAQVCCEDNSRAWITYPIVASSLIITAFIGYLLCCKKFKKQLLKRRVSNNNEIQINNPDIYRQTDINEIHPVRNEITNWEASPPSYNEIISSTKTRQNIEENKDPMPVLPNAITLNSDRMNHGTYRLSQIE